MDHTRLYSQLAHYHNGAQKNTYSQVTIRFLFWNCPEFNQFFFCLVTNERLLTSFSRFFLQETHKNHKNVTPSVIILHSTSSFFLFIILSLYISRYLVCQRVPEITRKQESQTITPLNPSITIDMHARVSVVKWPPDFFAFLSDGFFSFLILTSLFWIILINVIRIYFSNESYTFAKRYAYKPEEGLFLWLLESWQPRIRQYLHGRGSHSLKL